MVDAHQQNLSPRQVGKTRQTNCPTTSVESFVFLLLAAVFLYANITAATLWLSVSWVDNCKGLYGVSGGLCWGCLKKCCCFILLFLLTYSYANKKVTAVASNTLAKSSNFRPYSNAIEKRDGIQRIKSASHLFSKHVPFVGQLCFSSTLGPCVPYLTAVSRNQLNSWEQNMLDEYNPKGWQPKELTNIHVCLKISLSPQMNPNGWCWSWKHEQCSSKNNPAIYSSSWTYSFLGEWGSFSEANFLGWRRRLTLVIAVLPLGKCARARSPESPLGTWNWLMAQIRELPARTYQVGPYQL